MQVRSPHPGPYLASPMCDTLSVNTATGAATCVGYYPSFSSGRPEAGMCGDVASFNPAHIVDYDTCTLEAGSGTYKCYSYSGELLVVDVAV